MWPFKKRKYTENEEKCAKLLFDVFDNWKYSEPDVMYAMIRLENPKHNTQVIIIEDNYTIRFRWFNVNTGNWADVFEFKLSKEDKKYLKYAIYKRHKVYEQDCKLLMEKEDKDFYKKQQKDLESFFNKAMI